MRLLTKGFSRCNSLCVSSARLSAPLPLPSFYRCHSKQRHSFATVGITKISSVHREAIAPPVTGRSGQQFGQGLGASISSKVVGETLNGALPQSAYIHIPFCRRRCYYCDFPIQVVGDKVKSQHVLDGMDAYVELVCREIAIAARHGSGGVPLNTVYFGGGTPSLIHPDLLERIMRMLSESFGIASDAEISMEMDPGTFDAAKLKSFCGAGVNRVSLGVQAFQAELLKACGRAHGLSEVYEAIEMIKDGGITNWSLDLISSLPRQTIDDWRHSLAEAVKAGACHVSVYDLQVEEGTLFARWYRPGQQPLPSDMLSADLYSAASESLRSSGFEHYEVSNYALPGKRCRHNLTYWSGRPFHAFGLGAASYIDRKRFTRPRKMSAYAQWVSEYEASEGLIDWPSDSPEDQFSDALMLNLRLADGIHLRHMAATFGAPRVAALCGAAGRFVESGHMLALGYDNKPLSPSEWQRLCEDLSSAEEENSVLVRLQERIERLRLSDPAGFLMSNDIIASLFNVE